MLKKLLHPLLTRPSRHFFCTQLNTSEVSVPPREIDLTKEYLLDFNNINLEDYRDMNSKIKKFSGYSLLQVEPFPRMKIMKLGLIILENLRLKIPEDAMFRIYLGSKLYTIL